MPRGVTIARLYRKNNDWDVGDFVSVYNVILPTRNMQEHTEMRLCSVAELNLKKTIECGQCFRWNAEKNSGIDGGSYVGVVRGRVARIFYKGRDVMIECAKPDYGMWREYFDLDVDYSAITFGDAGEYFLRCEAFGRGIRILRQEFWEALCSFIISQCNNIPRIKGIVENMCARFGEPLAFAGEVYYDFPEANVIAALSAEELAPLRMGYRAPYILAAADACAFGRLDGSLFKSREEAVAGLLALPGVGAKVASCVMLYGLHDMEGFPIDTWMRRALKTHFPEDFNPKQFGEYAGLAQQYIFYYARSNNVG